MKKWISILLLVLVALVVTSSSKFFKQPPVTQTNVAPTVIATKQLSKYPKVNSQKLFAHVQALNFQRYTETNRDRARNYLTQSLKKFGWSPTLQFFEGGVNIFAQHKGTDPSAGAILLAAHYDTVPNSPGADDNATGVAVVLEVARLLTRPTPRTLQIAFFDQEEVGLHGSMAFANNKARLENLRGVIVLDMVGFACYTPGCQKYPTGLPLIPPTDKGDFLAAVGDTEHLPLLNAFQSKETNLPPVLTLPIPLKGILMPDTLRSDHAPFWYQGVGAVLLTDTANLRTPHYHQPSDIPTNIDRSFFTGAAQIIVNTTTKLLDRDSLKTNSSTVPSS